MQLPRVSTVCRLRWRDERGQATVEYAIVFAGFLALIVGLGALWRMLGDGVLVEHAIAVASHHVQAVAPVVLVDVLMY